MKENKNKSKRKVNNKEKERKGDKIDQKIGGCRLLYILKICTYLMSGLSFREETDIQLGNMNMLDNMV